MKSSCKSLKLSILLSCIFLIFIIIFAFLYLIIKYEIYEILLNTSITLFGGAFIALLLAIPAYNVSKTHLMERFWQETKDLLSKIDTIDYLTCGYKKETIVGYIHALTNKEYIIDSNTGEPKPDDSKLNKYKKELQKEYKKNHEYLNNHNESDDELNEYIDKEIEKIRSKACDIYKEYVNLSKESTINLNFMLGDMCFFTGEKVYKQVHSDLYTPIFELLNDVKASCRVFGPHLEEGGLEYACLKELFDLQEKLYSTEVKDTKETREIITNSIFIDEMLDALEKFRCKIYGERYEKQKHYPRMIRQYFKIVYKKER